ncbi:putative metallophosphoesterase At3g03305 [Neltuma alba]|uniref:putative metallophosphoesterase At3g03305 n=2 Tax=Neltuma alba TaxID=207710 RepID=UPI0010A315DA|nr:putative metallophosphoesterase At3g03305 [Prosopis alba]
MSVVVHAILVLLIFSVASSSSTTSGNEEEQTKRVIWAKGGPDSVVWVVQLSDLHFSIHHPDRALDFRNFVGPALSMINPSLVLVTGDLTDGKSKDLLTMKQNEDEWKEYQNVMEDVIKRSGLNKEVFFDLRGNHDSFGVPVVGGSSDFFSKYSINGQLGRSGRITSVTVETQERRHLFVGLDSTMSVGLRGPTNLFGHPTDELLSDLDLQLSHWDSQSEKPVSKISFGHFPLSFSAPSGSGRTLEDVFLKHSISAYLCGHLHSRFGKNLKRHHQLSPHFSSLQKFFQFNVHQISFESNVNCSIGPPPIQEFWEWEMGDWRKRRFMRILSIDSGHVSFVDVDFKAGTKKTIILPTFPLDSRIMLTSLFHHKYECQSVTASSFESIRALVFSISPIVSVVARVYDSRYGNLDLVLEAHMIRHANETSRGVLYVAPWNYQAFEDASPHRYWLQIEATDIMNRSTLTELRPFSINGHSVKLSWSWKEFFVMGCQWPALYYPMFWSSYILLFFLLLLPIILLIFQKKLYTYRNFIATRGLGNGVLWVQEFRRVRTLWFGFIGYLFYLILFPWFIGQVFTEGNNRGYMTYMGWVVKNPNEIWNHDYIGSPDIMMIVLPHLFFVLFPTILVSAALTAERGIYREHMLSRSGKKVDDHDPKIQRTVSNDEQRSRLSNFCLGKRPIRTILCLICLAICWKHFMNCRSLMKAYEMNPILHFLGYGLSVPILLAFAICGTRGIQ